MYTLCHVLLANSMNDKYERKFVELVVDMFWEKLFWKVNSFLSRIMLHMNVTVTEE